MKIQNVLGLIFLVLPGLAGAVGAIAVDNQQGDGSPGYGIVTGKGSQREAEGAAMAECRRKGNERCRIAVWFNGCGAYASSSRTYGVGWGRTVEIASANAMEKCDQRSCKVHVAGCD